HPAKAADLAAELVHEAQRRIESPFHQEEDLSAEEANYRESQRFEREQLFRNPISVAAAFQACNSDYKNVGRFASALRKAGLSYETLDTVEGGAWSVVELTSIQAVAMLPAWKKAHENKLNLENKK